MDRDNILQQSTHSYIAGYLEKVRRQAQEAVERQLQKLALQTTPTIETIQASVRLSSEGYNYTWVYILMGSLAIVFGVLVYIIYRRVYRNCRTSPIREPLPFPVTETEQGSQDEQKPQSKSLCLLLNSTLFKMSKYMESLFKYRKQMSLPCHYTGKIVIYGSSYIFQFFWFRLYIIADVTDFLQKRALIRENKHKGGCLESFYTCLKWQIDLIYWSIACIIKYNVKCFLIPSVIAFWGNLFRTCFETT